MSTLDFVRKLYNGKNCYSDHMTDEELALLHIPSKAEDIAISAVEQGRIVFLTGNPGDGKTFLIKTISDRAPRDLYINTDINNVRSYDEVAEDIVKLYDDDRGALIAVNEYPFIRLGQAIRQKSAEVYEELRLSKQSITYGSNDRPAGKILVLDLNERNLLGGDYELLEPLFERFLDLLAEPAEQNKYLKYNVTALKNADVRRRVIKLLHLIASDCKHFAIRDILGAIAFVFTACTTTEYERANYYSALFSGTNALLKSIRCFDPARLASPRLDEKLWSGEITDGWLLEKPNVIPSEFEDSEEALERFVDLKRKYYFEHENGAELLALEPQEIGDVSRIMLHLDRDKRRIREQLIRSLNKLFLPQIKKNRWLYVWTTHGYDMGREPVVAVSTNGIDARRLDILLPHPISALSDIEYTPNHIILKPKDDEEPILKLDVDFLRILLAIDAGCPANLIPAQYERAVASFMQKLTTAGLTEENDDGEILLADRSSGAVQQLFIENNRYEFCEEA